MAKLLSKDFKKAVLLKIAPKVIYVVVKLLYFTCKKRFYDKAVGVKSPMIMACWHGELLSVLLGYISYKKNIKLDSVISGHNDGEIIARVISLFGGGTIRGSSTRGGMRVIKDSFKSLDLGRDLAITPDGPKGPRHSVADGIVLISKKKNVPIVVCNCKPTSYWQFNSWDKFIIPKPFCTLDFYVQEPFFLDDLSLKESKEFIKERLMQNAV